MIRIIWVIYTKVLFIASALSDLQNNSAESLELNRQILTEIRSSPDDLIMFSTKEAAAFLNKDVKHLYTCREIKKTITGKKISGSWYYSKAELIRLRDKL